MYKSPIRVLVDEPTFDYTKDIDITILKAVQSVKVDVNPEELIKALQYDRDQYNRGYHDGACGEYNRGYQESMNDLTDKLYRLNFDGKISSNLLSIILMIVRGEGFYK